MKNTLHLWIVLLLLANWSLAEITPVRLKEGLTPPFPEMLKDSGEEGTAKVKVVINEEGLVTEAEIVSATHEAFGASALEAVRQWTFYPATEDGVPVSQTVTFPRWTSSTYSLDGRSL